MGKPSEATNQLAMLLRVVEEQSTRVAVFGAQAGIRVDGVEETSVEADGGVLLVHILSVLEGQVEEAAHDGVQQPVLPLGDHLFGDAQRERIVGEGLGGSAEGVPGELIEEEERGGGCGRVGRRSSEGSSEGADGRCESGGNVSVRIGTGLEPQLELLLGEN